MCQRVENAEWLPYAADTRHFIPGQHERSGAAAVAHGFEKRVAFCKSAGIDLISGLYREAYVEKLQQLKISVHHFESGGDGLIVMRPFEVFACGALLFAPQGLLDDLQFYPGVHYVAYNDAEDCKKKIERFTNDDESRQVMTRAALREIEEKHTYVQRAERILEAL
jgi:spore maturation protein CgeB